MPAPASACRSCRSSSAPSTSAARTLPRYWNPLGMPVPARYSRLPVSNSYAPWFRTEQRAGSGPRTHTPGSAAIWDSRTRAPSGPGSWSRFCGPPASASRSYWNSHHSLVQYRLPSTGELTLAAELPAAILAYAPEWMKAAQRAGWRSSSARSARTAMCRASAVSACWKLPLEVVFSQRFSLSMVPCGPVQRTVPKVRPCAWRCCTDQRTKWPVSSWWVEGGIGHPAFQVGLRAGVQGESLSGEPGEEVVGGGDVAANVEVLELGGVLVTDAPAESAQVVPDRVAVQDSACGKVRAGLDRFGDPFLQGDKPFVTRRQDSRGDEDAAKVREHLARRKVVEDVVGDATFIAADAFQQVLDLRPGDPSQSDIGALGTRQCLVEGHKLRADGAGVVAE